MVQFFSVSKQAAAFGHFGDFGRKPHTIFGFFGAFQKARVKRKAESGRRKAEGGRRRAESGKWKVESGKWKVESGKRKAEGGGMKLEN